MTTKNLIKWINKELTQRELDPALTAQIRATIPGLGISQLTEIYDLVLQHPTNWIGQA